MAVTLSDFLSDHGEIVKGILGKQYLDGVLDRGETFRKSVMILTDRRVYQIGGVFNKCLIGGIFSRRSGKRAINLSDVIGTGLEQQDLSLALFLACLNGAISALFLLAILVHAFHGDKEVWPKILPFFAGFAFGAIGPLLAYVISKKDFFIVLCKSGALATRCDWYPPQELEEFNRQILSVIH